MSLVSKLSDLTYIYEHLIAALADRYIDAEDRLDLLIQQIEKSEEIKGAEIYLDGFHRLTPKELRVVEALMKHCKQITVALTMDRSEEHTSELQSRGHLVCRLLLEKKKKNKKNYNSQ